MTTGSGDKTPGLRARQLHRVPPFSLPIAGGLDQVFVVIPDTAKKGPKREITIDKKC